MIDPNYFGRCRECKGRPTKGLDGLIGGICKRCWDRASIRIRERFASDTDGELRYSFHGHPRPFHAKKRKSTSRAEDLPGTDPAGCGRDEDSRQVDRPGSPAGPAAAATGARASAAPALEPVNPNLDPSWEQAYRVRAYGLAHGPHA